MLVPPCLHYLPQVSAARDAIGDADFFLVARTDARGANAKYGLEVRMDAEGTVLGCAVVCACCGMLVKRSFMPT
jgi:hypothetical protein